MKENVNNINNLCDLITIFMAALGKNCNQQMGVVLRKILRYIIYYPT
jgi:hypothetical protein